MGGQQPPLLFKEVILVRVANYYRVSTKLQEKRFSLAAQKEELTKYVKQMGWILIDEFTDVDSGGKLSKDGLNQLLDLVESGSIDAVLVVEQDRLSRLDTIAWEYLKSTLRENGVKIAEPGIVTDLSNEDDEFISDIKNLIARRQKKGIVRAMMRGKRQRIREGKGWGKPPFEYEYDKNSAKYKAKKEWKWVIPFIDNLYLNEQLGMKLISDRLNEISKTPTGGKWNEHLVHVRITSKAYHGVAEKKFRNGEIISTPGVYEPLRTEETYIRLQEERERRSSQFSVSGRKNPKNIHMLKRTKLTCGLCHRKINIVQHGTKKTPRYYAKHGRKTRLNGDVCDININTIRFDDNIIKALKEILTSEELAKKYINLEHDENEIQLLKKEIKEVEKEVSNLNSSLDKLLDLYLSGDIEKNKYLNKEKEIKTKLKIQEEELSKLKLKYKALESSAFSYENLYQYISIAQNIETELTPLERAQLLGRIFPKGILYNDKLVLITEVFNGIPIEVTIPIDPDPYPDHFRKRKNTHAFSS